MHTTSKIGIIVLLLVGLFSPSVANAEDLQGKINELNRQITENQKALEHTHDEVETLQDKINDLNISISVANQALRVTELEIVKTSNEINQANEELAKQRVALRKNIRLAQTQGDVTPLEVLASSNTLTDYFDKAQFVSNIQKKITQSLDKIKQLKRELDEKKNQLAIKRNSEQAQVNGIAAQRSQQQNLLAQTQGEESRYQGLVNDLNNQKKAVANEIAARAAAASRGNYVSIGKVSAGQVIGYMGSSGNSTGAHLHFSVISPSGEYINPQGSGFNYQLSTSGSVTQWYGSSSCSNCGYSFHNGIDIASSPGTPIRSVADGDIVIRSNGYNGGWGNYVVVRHSNGFSTLYGHMLPF